MESVHINAAEVLQAHTELWSHILNHVGSMSLKCAVELGIPDAIHHHARPITLSELSSALSLPSSKTSHLKRLMRVLTHNGVFSSPSIGRRDVGDEEEDDQDVYFLTPISRLLVKGKGAGLSPFVLVMLDPVVLNPFQFMGAWFKGDSPSPFSLAHGCGLWDETNKNPQFNTTFNAGTASDASFLMDFLVGECGGQVFRGLRSLVDVGGGTGCAAKAIAEAFPLVKCSVLDLPHVVDTVHDEQGAIVEFIAGDMFESVPPADAVFLKWILHDWNDDDCVKILRRCKEAIPSREEGGKVIIVDLVVGSKNSHPKSRETQLHWDMLVFVLYNSYEREEEEWKKIFVSAGFTDYKITPGLGLRSVIEVYP